MEYTRRDLSGMGRGEVEQLVIDLQIERAAERDKREAVDAAARKVQKLHDEMLSNLTSCQGRCTQLLEELRTWRRGEMESIASAIAVERASGAGPARLSDVVVRLGAVSRIVQSYGDGEGGKRGERNTAGSVAAMGLAVAAARFFLGG